MTEKSLPQFIKGLDSLELQLFGCRQAYDSSTGTAIILEGVKLVCDGVVLGIADKIYLYKPELEKAIESIE
jgi:hypothetical protein